MRCIEINYSDQQFALGFDLNTNHHDYTRWSPRIARSGDNKNRFRVRMGNDLTADTTEVWKNAVALAKSSSYFAVPQRLRSVAIQATSRF